MGVEVTHGEPQQLDRIAGLAGGRSGDCCLPLGQALQLAGEPPDLVGVRRLTLAR